MATRLPEDLTRTLEEACGRLGLRKNFVTESALREKLEELQDAEDLRQAVAEAAGFHIWEKAKKETARKRRP